MKKAIAILMSLAMVLALAAGCGSGDTTGSQNPSDSGSPTQGDGEYVITVALSKNEKSAAAMVACFDSITEKTDGRVKFDIYYSSSLLTAAERPKGVAQGIADITDLIPADYAGMFPLTGQLMSLPFMGWSDATEGVFYQLMEEFPEIQAEWDAAGLMIFSMNQSRPYNLLLTSGTEVRTPADINGSKIIALDDTVATLVQGAGGAPVSQPFSEWYSALEKNVANGIVNNVAAWNGAGLLELGKQFVEFGEGSGIVVHQTGLVMNPNTFNSLPEDIQAVFLEEMEAFHDSYAADLKRQEDDARAIMDEAGYVHTVLTDSEVEAWAALLSDITGETIAELEGQGLPAQAIYDRAMELIAEANQ